MKAKELLEIITFDPELSFEKNYSPWKDLDEKKMMVSKR
jgi:hypothetical protein